MENFRAYPEMDSAKTFRRKIEIPQRASIFQDICCLKVHNVHLKLALPISG